MILKVVNENVFNRSYSVGDYLYLPSSEDVSWRDVWEYPEQYIMVINNKGGLVRVMAADVEEVTEVKDLQIAFRKFFCDNGFFRVKVVRKLEIDYTYEVGDLLMVRDEYIKSANDLEIAKDNDWVVCQDINGNQIIVLAGEIEPI